MKTHVGTLHTIGRDMKPYTFQVSYERENKPEFSFSNYVWPRHKFYISNLENDLTNIFRFTVIEVENTIRVVEMMHEGDKNSPLRQKGIPDAMIEKTYVLFEKKLVTSSSNNKSFQLDYAEGRNENAEKVWMRLIEANKAKFDADSNMYIHVPALEQYLTANF